MSTLSDFKMPRGMRRTLLALCPIVCPASRVDSEGLAEPMVDATELFLRALAAQSRAAVVVGTVSFELGAAMRPRSFGRRFCALSRDEAREYFDSWWRSKNPALHNYAKGVKSMLALSYYELPTVRDELRYHPDAWINRVARERLARWGDAISAHEALLEAPAPLLDASRADAESPASASESPASVNERSSIDG